MREWSRQSPTWGCRRLRTSPSSFPGSARSPLLPSRNRRQHLDPIAIGHGRALAAELAVDVDVDMPPNQPSLIQNPARQRWVVSFQSAQEVADRSPIDRMLSCTTGELAKGTVDADDRHGQILRPVMGSVERGVSGCIRTLRPNPAPKLIAVGTPLRIGPLTRGDWRSGWPSAGSQKRNS